jgi:uncharacterized protein YjbJ (UPF0337 family)
MADDVNGKATHLGGRIKEGIGDLLGDRKMEREGRLEQMEGAAEQDASRAENALREAAVRKEMARDAQLRNDRDL